MPAPERAREDTLPLLKALGDETRFRCLEYVRDAGHPVSVAEVADELGLHQNTVRPHLERLREVGLLEVSSQQRGTVGRPQHVYSPAEDAPDIGLGPRNYHLLSELLAALASRLSKTEDAVEVGREWGRFLGTREAPRPHGPKPDAVTLVCDTFERLGFDPIADGRSIGFAHCPFRELAEAYPELICSIHRGLCEGLVELSSGGKVAEFRPLYSRDPCTVELSRR